MNAPELLRCPSCGAPVEGAAGAATSCAYCGASLRIGAAGPGAAADAGEAAPDGFYASRLGGAFVLAASLACGASLVGVGAAFARGAAGELAIIYAVALGLGALCMAGGGQKLLGVLIGLAGGLALVAKPFAVPIVDHEGRPYSPTSETACYFLVPGALLLAVTVLVAISLRAADLRPRAPRWYLALAFALGLGAAAAVHLQPTRAQVAGRHAERAAALRALLRDALARPADTPARATLDPAPRLRRDDRRGANDLQLLLDEQLEDPARDGRYFSAGGGELLELLRHAFPGEHVPDHHHRRADADFERACARAVEARYAAVYRLGDGEVEVFLIDLRAGRLVARGRAPCADPRGILEGPRAVLAALAAACNADVED